MALPGRIPHGLTALAAASLVVAILYAAEDVFMPVALAALLSFLLTPPTQWLERHRLRRGFAVLTTSFTAFALIAGLLFVVGNQFFILVQDLPQYKDNLVAKLRSLQTPLGGSFDETAETFKELSEEFNSNSKKKPPQARIPRVEVVQPPPTPMGVIGGLFGPLLKPLGTAGIVAVFVIFMLLERDRMRDRILRLSGARDLGRTTQALDEAMRRIIRYLGMQTLINGIQGTLVAIALHLIGVPNAALWGALTIVLRFIPYLGPWIAALMPIALSVAAFEGWTEPLLTAGALATLELISNNVLEPLLYGQQTGVSPLALMVAAVFWTWLWGLPGLFLAIPLTVSLVVMGKYIPQFRFFSVLFGDEPALEPHERFYQRLLARDPEEAQEVIDEAGRESSPPLLFDAILAPAITLAQEDHGRGALDDEQRRYVFSHAEEIARDWCEAGDGEATQGSASPASRSASGASPASHGASNASPASRGTSSASPASRSDAAGPLVLCVPANGEADALGAALLALVLRGSGVMAQSSDFRPFKGQYAESVAATQPACVCIVAFPPSAAVHAGFICKLLRGRFGELPIVAAVWNARGSLQKSELRLSAAGADRVVDSFTAAVQEVGRLLHPSHQFPAVAAR